METVRDPHVQNVRDVEALDFKKGSKFGGTRKRLAAAAGSKRLGCSWYEIPAGRQAFPHHFHYGNEEAFFILSGQGDFRLGAKSFSVKAGDYIACPVGGESAHSIRNAGTEPLQYLAFSTADSMDITVYPDSKKFGVVAGADMQKGLLSAPFLKLLKDQPNVDYFLDEE